MGPDSKRYISVVFVLGLLGQRFIGTDKGTEETFVKPLKQRKNLIKMSINLREQKLCALCAFLVCTNHFLINNSYRFNVCSSDDKTLLACASWFLL